MFSTPAGPRRPPRLALSLLALALAWPASFVQAQNDAAARAAAQRPGVNAPGNPGGNLALPSLGDGEGLKDITERAVRAVERAAIAAALRRDRNPAAAAKRLGISRASIYTKMKTYGLSADGEATES